MHASIILCFWAAVSLVAFKILSDFVSQRRYVARAKELGAKPAPVLANAWYDPLGILIIRRALAADKARRFPEEITSRFDYMTKQEGRLVSTMKQHILGKEVLFTCDPKNIQAMLALQFHDFGLGQTRRNNFFPLLGSGIFTSDGKTWEHSRAMLRPQFARDQISDLDLEERHVRNMMQALPVKQGGWTDEVDCKALEPTRGRRYTS